MSNTRNHRFWCGLAAACLLYASPAFAQSPPGSEPPRQDAPAKAAPKASPEGSETLRIRGVVESVDQAGVRVQLSKGLGIRVDIGADAAVFAATRVNVGDLQAGQTLIVRTRAGQAAGETTNAVEVLAVSMTPPPEFPGTGVSGVLKSVDRTGEHPVLVLTEGGADRRLTVIDETSFWRLRPGALKDVKAGMAISVLITLNADGDADARRAVFASTPPGAMLPL